MTSSSSDLWRGYIKNAPPEDCLVQLGDFNVHASNDSITDPNLSGAVVDFSVHHEVLNINQLHPEKLF